MNNIFVSFNKRTDAQLKHKDCFGLLSELSEQEDYEEGVSSEDFVNRVDDYVNDNHYQEDGWNGSVYERVKMIVKELEEEK